MSLAAFEDSLNALSTSLEGDENWVEQKNRRNGEIYYMWDYVQNTARLPDRYRTNREAWMEIGQRCTFANILINDTTGKLTIIGGGDNTQFGNDVKERSSDCQKKAEEWMVAEGLR